MAYTTIDDPSAYFQTLLYTGNGSSSRALTNDGNSDLQPDWLWVKNRSNVVNHGAWDSSRGAGKRLLPNVTDVEEDQSNVASFDSDGFSIGATGDIINTNTHTYVAWQWKANGGTTSSNTDGDITSTVQANTTAGFSIVTYTGNGTDGASIGHGLSGAWDVIIVKNRDATDYWTVDRDASSGTSSALLLHDPSQEAGHGTIHYRGSSGLFTAHSNGDLTMGNGSGEKYVAYVFKEIQGYSKFGSYAGNNAADGPFIYTGFKPAWVMTKCTSANSTSWFIFDNKRSPVNVVDDILFPNGTDAETTNSSSGAIDMLSNGFKIRGTNSNFNAASSTQFYMAFAESPFVSSEGVPITAR